MPSSLRKNRLRCLVNRLEAGGGFEHKQLYFGCFVVGGKRKGIILRRIRCDKFGVEQPSVRIVKSRADLTIEPIRNARLFNLDDKTGLFICYRRRRKRKQLGNPDIKLCSGAKAEAVRAEDNARTQRSLERLFFIESTPSRFLHNAQKHKFSFTYIIALSRKKSSIFPKFFFESRFYAVTTRI